jgi:hypothetical protein
MAHLRNGKERVGDGAVWSGAVDAAHSPEMKTHAAMLLAAETAADMILAASKANG